LSIRDRYILFALIAFGLVVKLLWLDVNELAHDEPFTVYWSQRPLPELWAMLRTENNPPLYFLLIKAWSAIVPFEAAWLRVPSALFSALTVWPLFLLARRMGGPLVAVIASLLFTLNNYHYGFAHEVRAYSLFALLVVSGMWLLWRAKDHPERANRTMLALAVINVGMVYTHFFGWLAIGLQLVVVLLLSEFRPVRRRFLIGLLITAVCSTPYALIFLGRLSQSVTHGTWLEAPVPEELYNMIWRWSNAPVLAVAFLAIIAVGLFRSRAVSLEIRFALLWTFLPLFGMFLVSFVVPIFLDRYLVYAAPGFALLVALSIGGLHVPMRASNALVAIVMVGMAFTFTPWKDSGRHPSRVVAQVNKWASVDHTFHVVPRWYWLNYLAAEDLDQLKEDQTPLITYALGAVEAFTMDPTGPTIVVDASGSTRPADAAWYRSLRDAYPAVDSLEADHRVWVYRFHR